MERPEALKALIKIQIAMLEGKTGATSPANAEMTALIRRIESEGVA